MIQMNYIILFLFLHLMTNWIDHAMVIFERTLRQLQYTQTLISTLAFWWFGLCSFLQHNFINVKKATKVSKFSIFNTTHTHIHNSLMEN